MSGKRWAAFRKPGSFTGTAFLVATEITRDGLSCILEGTLARVSLLDHIGFEYVTELPPADLIMAGRITFME